MSERILTFDIPKMKGEEMFTITSQLMKLRDEIEEALQAPREIYIEEIADVLHAAVVLARVAERNGINTEVALKRVIQKNAKRGYYENQVRRSDSLDAFARAIKYCELFPCEGGQTP